LVPERVLAAMLSVDWSVKFAFASQNPSNIGE
jgi:hypothetical protein